MMKHKRIPVMKEEGAAGFTVWIQPKPQNDYLLVCCDCGLSHKMQFRVYGSGKLAMAQFRAKRASGYTARERKRRHITIK